jgi:hypothetical protein
VSQCLLGGGLSIKCGHGTCQELPSTRFSIFAALGFEPGFVLAIGLATLEPQDILVRIRSSEQFRQNRERFHFGRGPSSEQSL